jgi:hypothetical protein
MDKKRPDYCRLRNKRCELWRERKFRNAEITSKIFNTKPHGARSVGRPKLRWEDGVVQDMRILGVNNLRKVALNTDEWAKLLKKVRAHQGLSSQ